MKLVIFAGGLGTRMSEETNLKPKPMLEIGGKPILWHIMRIYSHYDINEFVVCCGYKGKVIRDYFLSLSHKNIKDDYFVSNQATNDWKVQVVDTGIDTQTGGRLRQIKDYLDETFCLTYGDGLSDINIKKLIRYHQENKKEITITGVNPRSKYGLLTVNENNLVTDFKQKPLLKNSIINGGFMVCEKKIIEYYKSGDDELEKVFEMIAKKKQLIMYKHDGFWASMDTQRDKIYLNELWDKKNAKWKVWNS